MTVMTHYIIPTNNCVTAITCIWPLCVFFEYIYNSAISQTIVITINYGMIVDICVVALIIRWSI